MRILASLFIITFVTLMCALGQQRPQISADRDSIKVGESTKLTWRSDANSAFLLGVGKVSPIDVLGVSPNTTTEYILVTEKEGEVSSASVKVTVAGTKG